MIALALPLLLQAAAPLPASPLPAAPEPAAPAAVADGAVPMADVDPRLGECVELAATDPVTAVVRANQWIAGQGGVAAQQCMGLAEAGSGRWDRAEAAFVKAALMAQEAGSADEANLWMQAGNAALAGGQGATALTHLDRAVATGALDGRALGEVELDRARALVAAGRMDDAATALTQATELVPQDPLAWLLSATLARRLDRLEQAASAIATAAALAPQEPAVLLEQGNIAALSGQDAAARAAWQQLVRIAPGTPQADAATEQLAALSAQPGVTPAPAP